MHILSFTFNIRRRRLIIPRIYQHDIRTSSNAKIVHHLYKLFILRVGKEQSDLFNTNDLGDSVERIRQCKTCRAWFRTLETC